MEIMIIKTGKDFVKVQAGNKIFEVIKSCDMINVCCKNASNSAYNRGIGGGKWFSTFETAKDGYKSTAAKAAIQTAEELLK